MSPKSEMHLDLQEAIMTDYLEKVVSLLGEGLEDRAKLTLAEMARVFGGVGSINEDMIQSKLGELSGDSKITQDILNIVREVRGGRVETPETASSNSPEEEKFLHQLVMDSTKIVRKVVAQRIMGVDGLPKNEKTSLLFALDTVLNNLENFVLDHGDFYEEDKRSDREVDRIKSLIGSLRERVEKLKIIESSGGASVAVIPENLPVHDRFAQLKELVDNLEDAMLDVAFDPRNLAASLKINLFPNESGSLSLLEILELRLERAQEVYEIYSPERASNSDNLDHGIFLRENYLIPAELLVKNMKLKLDALIGAELGAWESTHFSSANSPATATLLAEMGRPLPTQPYSASNSPADRRAVFYNPQGGIDLVKDSGLELDSIPIDAGVLGDREKAKIEKIRADIKEYVEAIESLMVGEKIAAEIALWRSSVKPLVDVITDINSLTDPLTRSEEILARTCRKKLEETYNEAYMAGYLSPSDSNEELNREIRNLVGYDSKSGLYDRALRRISHLLAPVEARESDPMNMTWAQLADTIRNYNIDISKHEEFERSEVDPYRLKIYQAFLTRRRTPEAGETFDEKTERFFWTSYILLNRLDILLQVEGQIPAGSRADLFPTILKLDFPRELILKAATYHPEHGREFRRIIDELIKETCNKNSPISYNNLTSTGEGRETLKKYIGSKYRDRLRSTIYQNLTESERNDRVDRVLEMIQLTYQSFDFLTVALAELQKQTQTPSHQSHRGGRPLTDSERENWVALTRPDTALVHAGQRYGADSHSLLNWLTYMKDIPQDFGRLDSENPGHEMLVEWQKRLQMHQDAFYDISSFTGVNGIPPSGLYDPIFPDTRSYLLLGQTKDMRQNPKSPEMLVLNGEVWGPDPNGNYKKLGKEGEVVNYGGRSIRLHQQISEADLYELVALAGWKKILKATFADLPETLSRVDVVGMAAGLQGGSSNTGLIDLFIGSCGMAKMFPGRHMLTINPLFTHYIMRIFNRIPGERARERVFKDVVDKIRRSAAEEAGLSGYRDVLAQVLRNISKDTGGWSDDRVLNSKEELKMSRNLYPSLHGRRGKREAWVRYYTHQMSGDGYVLYEIPVVGGLLTEFAKRAAGSTQQAIDGVAMKDMIEGRKPLPGPGINRGESLLVAKDSKQG